MYEVPFNSTNFVLQYAEPFGISTNPIQYISMSGSMVTLPKNSKGHAYIHIYRVLQLPCENPYKEDGTYEGTCFQKPVRSFVYAQILNEQFQSVPGVYKNLEYPTVYDIYTPDVNKFPGPEDARAILDPWGNVILSFNMAYMDNNEKRRQWIFNATSGSTRINNIDLGDKQKNWVPFFRNNELLQVYSWNPIKVVDCKVKHRDCIFVEPNAKLPAPESRVVGHFRAGSALYQYRGYYVATTRTHRDCNGRVYRPHITVLSPELEPVYISEDLDFEGKLFIAPFWPSFPTVDSLPKGGHTRILTSLTMTPSYQGKDWIAEFSVNDQKNILVTFKNLDMFLDSIIFYHKERMKEPGFLVPELLRRKDEDSINLCAITMEY
jgi:hypothetical protein